MHPLDGAYLKVGRAKRHLDVLQRSIRCFLKRNPYTVSENNAGEYLEYLVQRSDTLPQDWGLLAGDFAHNLRSSLDHIAYEFNIRTSRPVSETRCQFPIFDTIWGYRGRGKGYFPDRPCGVKRIVNNLQPYHRRNRPKLQLLSILRDLDNTDKHRTITPVSDSTSLEFTEDASKATFTYATFVYPVLPFNLENGGYRVVLTPRVQEHLGGKIDPHLTSEVVFQVIERGTKTPYLISLSTLQEIYFFVKDDIIPHFKGFFIEANGGWITRRIEH